MPSDRALRDASHLKRAVTVAVEDPFMWVTHVGDASRRITYAQVYRRSELEYDSWSQLPLEVDATFTPATALREWLDANDVEEIARLLDETPDGVGPGDESPAYDFTPWQRLYMHHSVCMPYDRVASVTVSSDAIQVLRPSWTPGCRSEPLRAVASHQRGAFPSVQLCNLPTGCGKAAVSLGTAFLGVTCCYETLVSDYRAAIRNVAVACKPPFVVARLVLVVSEAQTFAHYQDTLRRCLPVYERMYPRHTFCLLRDTNDVVKEASEASSTNIFFAIVPSHKANAVLRRTPNVAVAVCVSDELCSTSHCEKVVSQKSPIVKRILTQATPHALVQATQSGQSWLRHFFGGVLYPPQTLCRHLRYGDYSSAQLTCNQACLLNVASCTAYRSYIAADLAELMPSHIDIVAVPARRMTLSSLLLESDSDIVPVTFASALCAMLHEARPTNVELIHGTFMTGGTCALSAVFDVFDRLEFARPAQGQTILARLRERFADFFTSCPICFERPGADENTTVCLYNCCGYCVCPGCFVRSGMQCPFCRTRLPTAFRAAEVGMSVDTPIIDIQGETVCSALAAARDTLRSTSQLHALITVLRAMASRGHTHLLVMVECTTNVVDVTRVDVPGIQSKTGVSLLPVPRISGKGTKFENVKRRFETATGPVALLTSSNNASFLFGTNLERLDGVVAVGQIPYKTLTQAIGRVFRPGMRRNGARGIPFVVITTAG